MPCTRRVPFSRLVDFMIFRPVMIQALEGEGAIAKNRDLMGAPIRRRPRKARFALISRQHRRQRRGTGLTSETAAARSRSSSPA